MNLNTCKDCGSSISRGEEFTQTWFALPPTLWLWKQWDITYDIRCACCDESKSREDFIVESILRQKSLL